ncbi:polysaccharide lyase family 14 protein [Jaapia argillacea MUCL 33604]|uniref:Polysaccharide lyase family 14 protein n=1 Tax=Jaapia argillacea MUCL 33604 TaxID=933084 RepID=A0A067PQY1_9AGAM|nr:polysaccharide lyase family 14 protein [Jaapia argillacea MUCL 33604]
MAQHLLPTLPIPPAIELGFTTSESLKSYFPQLDLVKLSDPSLNVHKISSRTTHNLVAPPSSSFPHIDDPTEAWEALYPQGSVNPANTIPGGFGFYLSGANEFRSRLRTSKEVLMSYGVMFQEGWEWVKGGKLPGIYGGEGDSAYGCTGGRQGDRSSCFNLRLMWRAAGNGEVYAYLNPTPNNIAHLLKVPPSSKQNPDYGFSVGRGAFQFKPGRWFNIAQRVKLNDVGHENGEIQLWIDGESVIHVTNLTLRESTEAYIQGLHFQTFFGGNSPDWASPKDQRAWFGNVSGVIISQTE